MNRTIGVDIAGTSYAFVPDSANSGTVTISGVALRLEQIRLIANATRGTIIYNFADAAAGAFAFSQITSTSCELTLVADTSTHDPSDSLMIVVDVDSATMIDAAPDGMIAVLLTRILGILLAPLGYRKDTQRYQASAVLESGTVTTVSTLTTVTNAVPVGNVATLGSLSADRLINSANWSAWADCHRSRIT